MVEGPTAFLEIRPYEINRFFLHALLVDPREWSDRFEQTLKQLFDFISNALSTDFLPEALKKSSYPPELCRRIYDLQKMRSYVQDQTGLIPKPLRFFHDGMIWLPEQVEVFEEWESISLVLGKEDHEQVYQRMSWRLKPILRKYLESSMVDDLEDFTDFLNVLPDSQHECFFSELQINVTELARRCKVDEFGVLVFFRVLSENNFLILLKELSLDLKLIEWRMILSDFSLDDRGGKAIFLKVGLNSQKQAFFLNDLLPKISGSVVEVMLNHDGSNSNLLTAYMIDAEIDTKDYLHRYQALPPVGRALVEEVMVNYVIRGYLSYKSFEVDLKAIYDQVYDAACVISLNEDYYDIYLEDYCFDLYALLFAGVHSQDFLKEHWTIFAITLRAKIALVINLDFSHSSLPIDRASIERPQNWNKDLIVEIANATITYYRSNFSIEKYQEFFTCIEQDISTTLSVSDLFQCFFYYEQLESTEEFEENLLVSKLILLLGEVKSERPYMVSFLARQQTLSLILNELSRPDCFLYKKVLEILSNDIKQMDLSSLKKIFLYFPSKWHACFIEVIGRERACKLMDDLTFYELKNIVKRISLQDISTLCDVLPSRHLCWLRFACSDFKIEGPPKLEDLQKKTIILQCILSLSYGSMKSFVFSLDYSFAYVCFFKKSLFKAYMIDAKIDTVEYMDQYSILSSFGVNVLEEVILDIRFLVEKLSAIDLKVYYDQVYQVVSMISQEQRILFNKESIKQYSFSLSVLLCVGLFSTYYGRDAAYWERFTGVLDRVRTKLFDNIPNDASSQIKARCLLHEADIAKIAEAVVRPDFSMKKYQKFMDIIRGKFNLGVTDLFEFFLRYEALEDTTKFNEDISSALSYIGQFTGEGVANVVYQKRLLSLMLNERLLPQQLYSVPATIALQVVLFFDIDLSQLSKVMFNLPPEQYGLFFESIGSERLVSLMERLTFDQVYPIFEASSFIDCSHLCASWPSKRVQELRYALSTFEIEDQAFESKRTLNEKLEHLGAEKKTRILQRIEEVSNESMIKWVRTHLEWEPSPARVFKAYMMDAHMDTEPYWRNYKALNPRQQKQLQKLIAEYVEDNNDFEVSSTQYHIFERRSSFHLLCDDLLNLIDNLKSEGKITEAEEKELRAYINHFKEHPEEYRRFLETVKKYDALAGGQWLAYMQLFVGWTLSVLTCGQMGNEWLNLGCAKLEQIAFVEKVVAMAKTIVENKDYPQANRSFFAHNNQLVDSLNEGIQVTFR